MQMSHKQYSGSQFDHPQHRLYPFEGGWELLRGVSDEIIGWMKGVWQVMEDIDFSGGNNGCLALFAIIGAFFLLLLELLIVLLLAVWVSALGTILGIWAGTLLLIIGVLRGTHWCHRRVYHIFYPCPFCYKIMPLPLYICSTCKKGRDARLWPSTYGILYHRCFECNARMPTLDSLGRRTVERMCPVCQRTLDLNFGQGSPIIFPLIGSVSSGKTCYMHTAIRAFKKEYEQRPVETRCTVQFMGEEAQQIFERQLSILDRGGRLEATRVEYARTSSEPEITPVAFCLKIHPPRRRVPFLVFFYDAPGEVFHSQRDVRNQEYYRYARGALLILDPCSIPAFRRTHEKQIESVRTFLGPSDTPVTVIENRVESMLELTRGIVKWRHFRHRLDMAVVISKIDALDLRREIALSAPQEGPHRQAEEFLRKQGLINMQEKLRRQFARVNYFSCSALGRLPHPQNQAPFVSDGVLEPLEWLLKQAGVLKKKDVEKKPELINR